MRHRTVLVLLVALAGALVGLMAQGVAHAQDADSLRVVMTPLEPFVIDDDGDPDGFYVEIWEEVASELGVDYEVIWVDSFGELLPSLAAGDADVAVAPLAPTAVREADFDFTSAVISSGPQLGYSERISTRPNVLAAMVDRRVLSILLYAAVGLLILAHVVWLLERGRHEHDGDFHPGYLRGIWDGIWWSMVTATTVGYGDRTPKSVPGRAVALLTMLLSLVLVGAFVSQVTAVLAESRSSAPFTSLDDVGDYTVGVVEGSSFAAYVEASGVNTIGFQSQDEVFRAVDSGTVDAIVANPFAMSQIAPDYGVIGVGGVLYEEFETFGLAQGSEWREPINIVLADLQASGEVEAIVARWID